MNDTPKVWKEQVIIPTYGAAKPDKNPMFLEKRVYQGSSGVVYPYPVTEKVFDEKEDKAYQAIFLENRYLKIMLLPELGGRVQMALDKTNDYHFIYYNQVIKPALVGLVGPWISGGIEFNWPQHHRPTTFSPVDYTIVENEDGTKTVWLSELERMFRLKSTVGFTLYPDKAYLEIQVQLYNRTDVPQTFLWWANPAVSVNDEYQSIFPPDVHAVMDHGKRDVSTFPIATGTYYKVDYSPGTDISRYKNLPVPTSYMAYHSDYDFLGCYDHGKQAGMMHIANHHKVPGKKQWTWGSGDFGQAWDRELTDEDGPYIELMCGAYTDNQPDFSWLHPGEEKRFTQYFMPFKSISGAKNANKDVVINLEMYENTATIGVYLTSSRTVTIELLVNEKSIFNHTIDLTPEVAFLQDIELSSGTKAENVTLQVLEDGQELMAYRPSSDETHPIPEPAKPVKPPEAIETVEELYLNGLHLEQYRHATYQPEPYYEEALRRDPLDSRCNNAMGLLLLRRGKFKEAEAYFRRAVKRITQRNPNPYDVEAYYNLGISLKMQSRYQEAFDTFYKATWNMAWQSSAYFELAQLATRAGRLHEALDLIEQSLVVNQHHHRAWHLKIALLRHLQKPQQAQLTIDFSLSLDPMNYGTLVEQYLLTGNTAYRQSLRDNVHNYIEIALDYAHAGLFDEAIDLLNEAPPDNPMRLYYLGWLYLKTNNRVLAEQSFDDATRASPDYCFPNRIESVLVLQSAIKTRPEDARAHYYSGNFWYAHRRYHEAIEAWETAIQPDNNFPTVYRNLGLAYVNKLDDLQRGLEAYQRAFALAPDDARVFYEMDQLYRKINEAPENRLKRLQKHLHLVEQRDDLTIEYVTLLNLLRRHQESLDILLSRRFHPWEGGEGKVTGQYVLSLVELAKLALDVKDVTGAIQYLEQAQTYPHNLGEGKLFGAQENHIFYYLGCAYEMQGNKQEAQTYYNLASRGLTEPTSAMFYNDQPPEMIYYQGLAQRKLNNLDEANAIFRRLINYGNEHLNDEIKIDYFAVSLPNFRVFDEDLNLSNRIHCHYMIAMGYLGLKDEQHARIHLTEVLLMDHYHTGARIHSHMNANIQEDR